MATKRAAIAGVGQTNYRTRHDDKTLPELAQEAALLACEDAAIDLKEIDAVVFSLAPTALAGVDSAERWASDAVGASGKPYMRINTGGATGGSAAQAGFYHVASGRFERVLVVGADKVAESADAQKILNNIWDPVMESLIPLNAITMCSLQAVRHMHKYGTTHEQMARVSVRARENAARNPLAHLRKKITIKDVLESRPVAWPLNLLDCCPRSSGGCAVVIVSEETARRSNRPVGWINGVGACTNTYWMGDKMSGAQLDHADWDDLAMAAEHAYRMAGISAPQQEIDVAEIYAPFTSTELAAAEALKLCGKGEAGPLQEKGIFEFNGEIPISPSGGTLAANPIAVTALARVAEAALQVRGTAEERQVDKPVRNAVATGVGGSLQFHTAMVLGQDPV